MRHLWEHHDLIINCSQKNVNKASFKELQVRAGHYESPSWGKGRWLKYQALHLEGYWGLGGVVF